MTEEKKIIVIEDDHDFRESMLEYLELAGLNASGVSSALEFYQALARGERFLLAIVDIGLPDQNGHILAEYIRKNTDMRIVMLTAQSSLDSKVTAYRSGADLYLVKPVDFAELAASLSSILGRLDQSGQNRNAPSPAEPPKPAETRPWVLKRNDNTLCTPANNCISLTSREIDLLEILASSPAKLVSRTELLEALDYSNDDLGNRALDALVHRLRRKKEELDEKIPIKTMHGSGYVFSAKIVIE